MLEFPRNELQRVVNIIQNFDITEDPYGESAIYALRLGWESMTSAETTPEVVDRVAVCLKVVAKIFANRGNISGEEEGAWEELEEILRRYISQRKIDEKEVGILEKSINCMYGLCYPMLFEMQGFAGTISLSPSSYLKTGTIDFRVNLDSIVVYLFKYPSASYDPKQELVKAIISFRRYFNQFLLDEFDALSVDLQVIDTLKKIKDNMASMLDALGNDEL